MILVLTDLVRLGVRSIFGRWRGVLLIVLPVLLLGICRCWCGCSSARTPTRRRARSTASGSS